MKVVKNKLRNYLKRLQNYPNVRLVLEVSLIANLPKIVIFFLFTILRILSLDFGGNYSNNIPTHPALKDILFSKSAPDTIFYIFAIVVIVPFLETLVGQYLPIKISSYFFKNSFIIVGASTVVFTLMHVGRVDPFQVIMGIILGTVFLLKSKVASTCGAIGITFAIHSTTNLIAILFALWWFLL